MRRSYFARLAAILLLTGCDAQAGQHGPLNGVYFGFRTDPLNNKVKSDHYTFLPDGRAFRGYPAEGLGVPVDWDYECRFAECGSYQRRDGQIVFRNAEAGAETVFSVDAAGVLRKPSSSQGYRSMHLLDQTRLSGTWGVFDPGKPPIVSITFSPDGRFEEVGLLSYLSWAALGSDASRRAGQVVPRGTGAYTLTRGALELRYDRGPVARTMIATPPAVPPGPRPQTLHVGGAILDRAP